MASSLLGLAPGGGYLAIRITTDAGGLLHHLFTITPRNRGAVCFCGPHPAGYLLTEDSPPRVLSDAVLYGVRTFLDPDNAGPRSPNRPEATSSYTHGRRASTGSFDAQRLVQADDSQSDVLQKEGKIGVSARPATS